MSDAADLLDEVLRLRRDLEEHKIATRNMHRVGRVTERDHEKGVRIEHGTDDAPDKSPWIQPAERSGVERDLPRVGEQMMVLAPYGDPEQGQAIPFGHSDEKKNPAADADETVIFNRDGCTAKVKGGKLTWEAKEMSLKVGKSTVTLKEGETTITVDGKTYKLDGDGHTLTGGKLKHEGRNVGSDHVHSGVLTGGAKTRPPDA